MCSLGKGEKPIIIRVHHVYAKKNITKLTTKINIIQAPVKSLDLVSLNLPTKFLYLYFSQVK